MPDARVVTSRFTRRRTAVSARVPVARVVTSRFTRREGSVMLAHINARMRRIRSRATNHDLRNDLMDHLWNRYGNEEE